MEFQTIEEQQDVVSLSVAEVSASDVEEIGQQSEPESFRLANSKYADPIESVPVVTIEEILTVSSKDSPAVQAAKSVINELLSRQNRSHCSHMKYTVSTGSGVDRSAPSLADFAADVTLCAKRSLPRFQYQVFCWAIDNGFDGWHRVPEAVRKNIFENTGAELLRRKIWDGRSTRRYWENNFKKYGRPRTVAASFRLV